MAGRMPPALEASSPASSSAESFFLKPIASPYPVQDSTRSSLREQTSYTEFVVNDEVAGQRRQAK
jgi:hypothetical protein